MESPAHLDDRFTDGAYGPKSHSAAVGFRETEMPDLSLGSDGSERENPVAEIKKRGIFHKALR